MTKRFIDYSGKEILMSVEAERHIALFHSEISIEEIQSTLSDPGEVRKSSYHATSALYYRLKSSNRFICVVVKLCSDGYFISSAMTATKPKSGEVIYVRKG